VEEHNLLKDVGLSVLGAAALALPAYLLRLPLMLAYLAAGVILGPHLGLSWIKNSHSIETLSEIGLILLMFILGLEIDIRKLLQAGKAVLVNGVTQFVGCALLAVGFFSLLGYRNAEGSYLLVYLAVACSLSSTLIVVKILSDRMELDTFTSRITLGILVLQDMWAIAFLAVQPNLADLQAIVLVKSLGRAVLLVLAGFLIARFILPRLFATIGKQPELMLVAAMAWCFAMCGLAESLHLSLEMGALIAGVSIASFPYHVDIAVKVSALRDFFITLFFVALGLQIPKPTAEVLTLTGAVIAFVLLSRVLTVFPVLHLLKYGNYASLIPAINLSQLSEFALVLAALGVSHNHIGKDVLSAFILAMVATALLSSVLIPRGHAIYRAINPLLEKTQFKDKVVEEEKTAAGHEHAPQIVLLGFYREASSLLREMMEEHSENALKHVMVVDFNPEAHKKLREMGVPCEYGDISHSDTLRHLDLSEARILVCTIPDHLLKGTSNLKILRSLKELAPNAKIVVTAEKLDDARAMYQEGAAYVFIPRFVAAQHLADVLEHLRAGTGDAISVQAQSRLGELKEVLP